MNFFYKFQDLISQVFESGVNGISFFELIIISFITLLSLILRGLFAKIIIFKLKKIFEKTGNKIDDTILDSLSSPLKLLPIVFVFIVISFYIQNDTQLAYYIERLNKTLVSIFVFWIVHQSLVPFSRLFYKLEDLLSKAVIIWLTRSLKYLIIFLGIVAVLEVWGIKIGPVIAGLGLFGVAVALGAQDLFKNLISGIMILLEKRFQIGDVISVPGHTEGTVEHIGFRSTLIRKFDTTPITIPNYIFAEAPILNYTNRNFRRINWTIGLEYNSTLLQIKKLTEAVSDYLKDSDKFIVDEKYKSFVRIEKFNDSSIDIMIICFTSTKDWETYLEIKEDLAIKIKETVEKIGLSFAFPSQSIYIEKNTD